ncbi:hypothetical protein Pmani_010076 [Petrolisthes manimaculis]|uniref:Uncharacterized protein n=1 Tax=Petrolisthes manimaculis TaxID=1843537 RepID=A0AAE1Q3W1_9EUCA|nr:hypothetical protein Pmani_010076 [Petrolisthes manimaculis]
MPPTDGEAAGYLGTLLYLIFRKYPYQRLDGRIRGNMHQATIHRFCTYGTLMEEDNCEDDFCEEDINQILSRRTTVIQHESEKVPSESVCCIVENCDCRGTKKKMSDEEI